MADQPISNLRSDESVVPTETQEERSEKAHFAVRLKDYPGLAGAQPGDVVETLVTAEVKTVHVDEDNAEYFLVVRNFAPVPSEMGVEAAREAAERDAG